MSDQSPLTPASPKPTPAEQKAAEMELARLFAAILAVPLAKYVFDRLMEEQRGKRWMHCWLVLGIFLLTALTGVWLVSSGHKDIVSQLGPTISAGLIAWLVALIK